MRWVGRFSDARCWTHSPQGCLLTMARNVVWILITSRVLASASPDRAQSVLGPNGLMAEGCAHEEPEKDA